MRPLKVGFVLPNGENQLDGDTPRWSDLAAMATSAEAVGFDSIWLADHFLFRPESIPGQEPVAEGMWECCSLLAALAAITERVEVGAMVICTGFRNPALLAKMAETIDEISNGRLILGIGAGWHEPEFRAFGYPFDHRVSRFEETVQIIASLLRTGRADFHGQYTVADDCELRPRGPRTTGAPLLIGTIGDRMLDLTARYADMWNVGMSLSRNDFDLVIGHMEKVDAACAKVGRDPTTLGRSCRLKVEVGPYDHYELPFPHIKGSPAEIADLLRQYAAAGFDHVQLSLEPNTVWGIEAFEIVLKELDGDA